MAASMGRSMMLCSFVKSDENNHHFQNKELKTHYAFPRESVDLDQLPIHFPLETGEFDLLLVPATACPIDVLSSPASGDGQISLIAGQQLGTWTDGASRKMIMLYEEKIKLLREGKIKKFKHMWEEIATVLSSSEYVFTPKQVEDKWHTLERAYKKAINNVGKSGRGRKICPYQTDLKRILGDNPNIRPEADVMEDNVIYLQAPRATGLRQGQDFTMSSASCHDSNSTDEESDPSPPAVVLKFENHAHENNEPKRKKKKMPTVAEELMRKAMDLVAKLHQETERNRQERHSEKMDFIKKLTDAIKK